MRLHMSALCAPRHDLPLLFDEVAICQIDCWRTQPNTELPQTCNELISFPDSAPPPPAALHYYTVQYSTMVQHIIHHLALAQRRQGPAYTWTITSTTQHSRSVSDSPSPFALSSRQQRRERATPEPCSVRCWEPSPPAVHRGIDTFVIRLLNSPAPLLSFFDNVVFSAQ